MSSLPVLDQLSFPAHLADHPTTVVKFGAPWCGPCKAMAPMLERAADEFKDQGISIVEVDVDKSPHLAAQFSVRSLPTLIGWKDGVVQWTKIGLPNANDLRSAIGQLAK